MARGAGLSDEEFWSSTPYMTLLAVRGRAQRAFEQAAAIGWWSAILERQQPIGSLTSYLRPSAPVEEEALAAASMAQWAAEHGLAVDDVDGDSEDG